MTIIIKNQYRQFGAKAGKGIFDEMLSEDVLCCLCQFHPRKVRKILEMACGRAAYQERTYITVEDVLNSDKDKPSTQRGIGFLASNI